ncbi:MAG: hypothetical protein RL095_1746 [Verrucomicrobiota bacterium]|jgi:hypothetical protein
MSCDNSSIDEKRMDLLARCARDPLLFVQIAFPWGEPGPLEDHEGPDDWAVDILTQIRDALRKPRSQLKPIFIAVASGHGIGKSCLVSWISLWSNMTCPDSKGLVTANTEAQLVTKTWPEISKWFELCLFKDWFKMTDGAILSRDPSCAKTWRFDKVTWSEHNTEAFAGLHNQGKRLLLVFDEASNIADKVWEVAEGALTDKETEIIWVAFGNPTRNSGRFFECFHARRARWITRQIDSRTVKITNKAVLADMVAENGEDSDFVKVRIKGQFPSSSTNQFLHREAVLAAQLREVTVYPHDPIVIGVDVARFGSDRSTIWTRRGDDCIYRPPLIFEGKDTMQLAAQVVRLAAELHPDAIFIDGTGVGGGVIDRVRQLGWSVIEVYNNGKATQRDFADWGAECWGNLKANLHRLRLPRLPAPGGAVDRLVDELCQREYHYDAQNRLKLESKDEMKKRGLASPDIADGLALTFALPVGHRDPQRGRLVELGAPESSYGGQINNDFDPFKQ